MTRSASEIEAEARTIGDMATKGTSSDNQLIQVLCALVEELANRVARLEAEHP